MLEDWRSVVGYEGRYEVSNFGDIRSIRRKKIMKQQDHYRGYKVIWLPTHKKHFVHRLVAIAFISNPSNVSIVNHKDCNKKNNHVANLEWMTCSENTQYYYDNKVYKAGEIF